jgi:CheY-like chemotaxis protein/nitrogen-specific signal transduction histidine kinase
VSRDITERVNLEEQLRQAQKMEAIGQLTGGIAHDFNNLLTVISGNVGLLRERYERGGETVPHEVHEVARAALRGADMVAQLLRFGRRGQLRRELVNPAETIAHATSMLRHLLPETVALRLGGVPPHCTLSLDTGALEQIIANLCTNARDAMPAGGTIAIECEVARLAPELLAANDWLEPGEYFQIRVRDTGAGMDDGTLRRVFEPFFTTKPVGSGTGLGMSMVYGLMKAHRGLVEAASVVGQGTTITVSFPLVHGPLPEVAARPEEAAPREGTGHEGILVVEDDEAIRAATRRALESRGYRVWTAEDGADGLAAFQAHGEHIALIVSDLVMPNFGGREMAETLRAAGVAVPILFTSGYSADRVDSQLEALAHVQFLPKPWTIADLRHRVREAIDGIANATANSTGKAE